MIIDLIIGALIACRVCTLVITIFEIIIALLGPYRIQSRLRCLPLSILDADESCGVS